jgi:hypothetical protein
MSAWLIVSLAGFWAAVTSMAILLANASARSDQQSEAALLRHEATRYRPRGLLDPEPVEEPLVGPPAPADADREVQVDPPAQPPF